MAQSFQASTSVTTLAASQPQIQAPPTSASVTPSDVINLDDNDFGKF